MGTIIGKRIKQLREEKNITTIALAEIIGVERTSISKWETGARSNPTSTPLKKLSEYFGVSMDYLLGLSDERVDVNTTLMSIFNNLNVENKMSTIAYVKELEVKQNETKKS